MKQLFLLVIFSLLTGCSFFTVKTTPDSTYILSDLPKAPKSHPSGLTLLVSPIETDPVYNTAQIAYTNKPYQISYFSKNGWAQPPAQMLQPLLVQTLQNTHFFHAVTTATLQYDYALTVHLVELRQIFLCQSSFVRMKLRAQIMSAATGKIAGTKTITIIRNAPSNNPYGGVIAANRASSDALFQLARFTLRTLKAPRYR